MWSLAKEHETAINVQPEPSDKPSNFWPVSLHRAFSPLRRKKMPPNKRQRQKCGYNEQLVASENKLVFLRLNRKKNIYIKLFLRSKKERRKGLFLLTRMKVRK